MIPKKLHLILSCFLLGGIYFLTLFLFSGGPLLFENAFAIITVLLTATFLISGLAVGVAGVVIAGIAAETFFALSTGTIIIGSACAGFAMLHLSKIQSLSFPWRGAIMAAAGAVLWSGLVELMHCLQPGNSLSGVEAGLIVAWQGFVAAAIWLGFLMVYLGVSSLFKQPRSRDII